MSSWGEGLIYGGTYKRNQFCVSILADLYKRGVLIFEGAYIWDFRVI